MLYFNEYLIKIFNLYLIVYDGTWWKNQTYLLLFIFANRTFLTRRNEPLYLDHKEKASQI